MPQSEGKLDLTIPNNLFFFISFPYLLNHIEQVEVMDVPDGLPDAAVVNVAGVLGLQNSHKDAKLKILTLHLP